MKICKTLNTQTKILKITYKELEIYKASELEVKCKLKCDKIITLIKLEFRGDILMIRQIYL